MSPLPAPAPETLPLLLLIPNLRLIRARPHELSHLQQTGIDISTDEAGVPSEKRAMLPAQEVAVVFTDVFLVDCATHCDGEDGEVSRQWLV
jgi:hypothetical protein